MSKPIFKDECGHYCLKEDAINQCCKCRTYSREDCEKCKEN